MKVHCPACKFDYCFHCRRQYHGNNKEGECPEPAMGEDDPDANFYQYVKNKETSLKHCPNCKMSTEKSSGRRHKEWWLLIVCICSHVDTLCGSCCWSLERIFFLSPSFFLFLFSFFFFILLQCREIQPIPIFRAREPYWDSFDCHFLISHSFFFWKVAITWLAHRVVDNGAGCARWRYTVTALFLSTTKWVAARISSSSLLIALRFAHLFSLVDPVISKTHYLAMSYTLLFFPILY